MNNNNKNKRIAVRKKIIYRKSNLSHTLDMQSIPSHIQLRIQLLLKANFCK